MIRERIRGMFTSRFFHAVLMGILAGCDGKTAEQEAVSVSTAPPSEESGLRAAIGATSKTAQPGPNSSGASPVQSRPTLPIREMTRAQFEATWQVDVNYDKRPLGEVLIELTKPVSGWAAEIVRGDASERKKGDKSRELAEILKRPVTLKASRISRLEAIERACRAAGVAPVYETPFGFRGKSNPQIQLRDFPLLPVGVPISKSSAGSEFVQFFGPFRVQITKILERVPHATGVMEFRMTHLPLPEEVEEMSRYFPREIDKIVGIGGIDVLGRRLSSSTSSTSTVPIAGTYIYGMKNLLRSVNSLEKISGNASLKLPAKLHVLWCDDIASNTKVQNGPLTLQIRNAVGGSTATTSISYTGRSEEPAEQVHFFAFDHERKPLKISGQSTSWSKTGGRIDGSFMVAGKPASLAMVVVSKIEAYSPRFTFSNIPLSATLKQPEKLARLEFAGKLVPLSIMVSKLEKKQNFHNARLQLNNHSNKAIEQAKVSYVILDENGKVLKRTADTLQEFGFLSENSPVLVAEKSTREREQVFFFLPDEGKKIDAQVTEVIFADGTEWKAEAKPAR